MSPVDHGQGQVGGEIGWIVTAAREMGAVSVEVAQGSRAPGLQGFRAPSLQG